MQGCPLSLPKRAFLSRGWPADPWPHLCVSDQWICGSLPRGAAFIGSVSPPHWSLQEAIVPPHRFPRGGQIVCFQLWAFHLAVFPFPTSCDQGSERPPRGCKDCGTGKPQPEAAPNPAAMGIHHSLPWYTPATEKTRSRRLRA